MTAPLLVQVPWLVAHVGESSAAIFSTIATVREIFYHEPSTVHLDEISPFFTLYSVRNTYEIVLYKNQKKSYDILHIEI